MGKHANRAHIIRAHNPSRIHIRRYNTSFARGVAPDMYVLDAGAGRAPYRDLFSHAHYETADFALLKQRYAPLTYVCDLTAIPVEDARFDRIVCNQVLEHVPEPAAVLREFARVTKDGGLVLLTCPFFYAPHQLPFDFYRYTTHALRRLVEQADFDVHRLEWVEGYFASVGLQFQQMHSFLPKTVLGGRRRGPKWLVVAAVMAVLRALAYILARLFYRLDLTWKFTSAGYPKNYLVIAQRRPREQSVSES